MIPSHPFHAIDLPGAAIERARVRISDPARWTQGVYARDICGIPCMVGSKSACKWCAAGALALEGALLAAFYLSADGAATVSINDYQGHTAALAALAKMRDWCYAGYAKRLIGGA